MWRVKFNGLASIIELFLHNVHLIQGISTNNFPLYCVIVPISKDGVALALINVVLGSNVASHFVADYI